MGLKIKNLQKNLDGIDLKIYTLLKERMLVYEIKI